ncbi:MAG: pyruvate, phosphate dikinase [Acidobacteria bacterium]|nr:pyruvate, phosphate dikinase [Acidobacteriota bacterium]
MSPKLTPFNKITPDPSRWGALAGSLSALTAIGASVPPGFVMPAAAVRRFLKSGELDGFVVEELPYAIEVINQEMSVITGDGNRPLLLAVRASTPVPMPGRMDTMVNVGMTPDVRLQLDEWAGELQAAHLWLNFVSDYARTVRRVSAARIANITAMIPESPRAEMLNAAAEQIALAIADETQRSLPTDAVHQTIEAIEAVCASWQRAPARAFRTGHGLDDDISPAVLVHAMVLPKGKNGGVGVSFSRSPTTGKPVVTGGFDPTGLLPTDGPVWKPLEDSTLRSTPQFATLARVLGMMEKKVGAIVRVDFVTEDETLWCLEARPAELTAAASIRAAVNLVEEGIVGEEQALLNVDPDDLETVTTARITQHTAVALTRGSGAAPGAAAGVVCLDAAAVEHAVEKGIPAILVTREMRPEDMVCLSSAAGVLADRGGKASHAALVTRGIGTPAVIGASDMFINLHQRTVSLGDTVLAEGDWITLDGTSGAVFPGALTLESPAVPAEISTLLTWADKYRQLEVWGNVDDSQAAAHVRAAHGEGIGLARTEYMFSSGDRLSIVRQVLTADDPRTHSTALGELERAQIGDFELLLASMDGKPVVVRLLDPPLHEFLPSRESVRRDIRITEEQGLDADHLKRLERAVSRYEESNPMLGLRGVRLAIVIPEIYRVQVLAALEAVRRRLDAGGQPQLHIMVPLVGSVEELTVVRDMIEEEVHQAGRLLEVKIGTMIELPRAALVADAIALQSDFFSFGTNDLTQTTLGISRDDAEEAFLRTYIDQGLLAANPFQTLDIDGVGQLMSMAINKARGVNPSIQIGVCGEHGGDTASIAFFHDIGVDYVSCSVPRIASARLAAAQAAINNPR